MRALIIQTGVLDEAISILKLLDRDDFKLIKVDLRDARLNLLSHCRVDCFEGVLSL